MKKTLRFLPWLAVLLWMALIFFFSTENAAESSDTSGCFIRFLLSALKPGFSEFAAEEQTVLIESFSHPVRKAAHFTLYTVLGFLLCGSMRISFPSMDGRKRFLSALAVGALYAVSDEIHQYFVPGRACMIRDMLLDSAGVLTGCLICMAPVILRRKRGNRNTL